MAAILAEFGYARVADQAALQPLRLALPSGSKAGSSGTRTRQGLMS